MPEEHDLDASQIDDRDEISGDEQQMLVWCNTHRKWEWHWLPIDVQPRRKPPR
jgi:hypothetical protein